MPLKEYIYSILIVSASDSFNASFIAMLPKKEYSPIDIVQSISGARRKISEREYDFIIVNTPLPDDFGSKFAVDICDGRHTVAILLVKNDIYDGIYDKVQEHGVLTLRKPVSVTIMKQALDWMRVFKHRLKKLEKKNISLEDKMAEIRIVNRAKWVLIDSMNMSEAEAHRYIEKQAMDRCITRREVAEETLKYSVP
ncbi:ANTAR domain-containing response regulator [Luxibacter massiliensis]|uniref:ANTAR domain-containing response regulator n=1 Tax=Luxibacter massiliensis TaxID=2219695 RepID=UPI000F04D8AB|nr:ANTAR domain-containing protein [Luxibacter massiliensis]